MNTPSKGIANLSQEKKRALLAQLLENKATEQKSFPLSYSQQRLWFLDQLESKNPTYNIPAAFRSKGRLDLSVLEETLNTIQRRHKILQTKFVSVDGKPAQIIDPEMTTKISVVDLQDHPENERETTAWRLLEKEIQQPFELAKGPLLRASLFRLGEKDHILLLTMHHIISDGWSMGLFRTEMIKIYGALSENRTPDVPKLPQQYSDFSVRQKQWMEGEGLERQLSYWKNQLDGTSTALELATDHPRPSVQTFNGTRRSIELTKELTRSVNKLSLDQGCTPFMILLAAFKIILYRYTDQIDITVGTPIANRDQEDIENLIGFFINTLVLRTNLSGNPSFQEVLKKVREVSLSAYDHQDLPFEKLVEELQPPRDLSRSPFFQVLFSVQNTPTQSLELRDLTFEVLYAYNGKAKFDLSIYLWEKSDQISGVFEYNTDLFDTDTIARMIEHFKNILQAAAANPIMRISDLPLLVEREREQLLVEWNATEKEYPSEKCFHKLFETQAEQTPDSVAVEFDNKFLTYHQLNARANNLAHHLQKLGVGPDVLVGICVERSVEMLVGLLGIMKAGGAYVPLDPSYPKERLAYMVEDSGIAILLSQKQVFAELPENGELGSEDSDSPFSVLNSQNSVLCLDSDWEEIEKESDTNLNSETTSTNLAYVIYTSGSTGKPKGVAIEHQTLLNFLISMSTKPGLTSTDSLVAVTTLSFDIAGLELYLPLIMGSRVVLASRETASDGGRLSSLITESGATMMQATPATWRMLVDSGWSGCDKLRILCGGEALPRELANQLLKKGAGLWNMYGPTETTIWSSVHRLESKEGIVPLGPPIANTQIYLLDKNLQPVPIGVYGELYIAGDGLARGYLNRPELTAEKFVPNGLSKQKGARMYRTGDLARYLPDGKIELFGRIDHQVKIRGFRIELGEIEATLVQHPEIDEVVVAVRDDEGEVNATKDLVAYLVSKSKKKPTVSELRHFLLEILPEYMVPNAFVFLESFPLTPNGKVDRKALPAPDGIRPELEAAFVAPQNEVERTVAGVWQEVLGVEKVGVDDNFFDLGGHSLLLVQVQSKLQNKFKRDLSIVELFKYPTINALVKSFDREGGESADLERIHDLAKKQKDAFARQKKIKEEKRNDGRLEYA